MRTIAQTWTDLIYRSGGEVSLPKSCWWLVWWQWKAEKAHLASVAKVDAQIKLINRQAGVSDVLKQREPEDAIRQLGLKNDLLGTQKVDFEKRHTHSVKMVYRIRKQFISPKNA
eukprot:7293235-Ditylum_brightwellii.AAC.1